MHMNTRIEELWLDMASAFVYSKASWTRITLLILKPINKILLFN